MNPRVKAVLSELMVLERVLREDHEIAIPYGSQKGWDILVKVDGSWQQWQIKTVWFPDDGGHSPRISIGSRVTRVGGQLKNKPLMYKGGEFDWLIAVDVESGRMWKLPAHAVIRKQNVVLEAGRFEWVKRGELTGTAQITLVKD